MKKRSYKVALSFPDIPERVIQGCDIELVDHVLTFYYNDLEEGLFVICEENTGRSISYAGTLKEAKERALKLLSSVSPERVRQQIQKFPILNPHAQEEERLELLFS